MDVLALVVAAGFDGGGAEHVVQVVALRVLVHPFLDRGEHVSVDLDAVLAYGWVVEDAENVVTYFVYWDARVFPGVENAAR